MKVKEAIEYGIDSLQRNNLDDAKLIVKILLSYILNQKKEYLIIHGDDELSFEEEKSFIDGINKLVNNIPIQYITNKQEFMGYEFYVDENVLIPQPDTETLVEEVLAISNKIEKERINILDLCTGSGAIGISLYKMMEEKVNITCSDISKEAIKIAEKNCINNTAVIKTIQSNLFDDIFEKFDIIVSNPPYIETEVIKTLPKQVQLEPKLALDGGIDGLDFYRRIIKDAKEYLNNGGYLALEIGYNQKNKVEELFVENNYKNIYSKKDLGRK